MFKNPKPFKFLYIINKMNKAKCWYKKNTVGCMDETEFQ